MKRHLTQILLAITLLVFTNETKANDRWETLHAINLVENPTNHAKIGRYGELGPYQFRPATWRMHTSKPFSQAAQRQTADEVAVIHYEWIKKTLIKAGVDASPFNIAMAWNSGVDNVLKGRAPAVTFDYAQRVTNLVQTLKSRETSRPALAKVNPAPLIKLHDQSVVRFTVLQEVPRFTVELPDEAVVPVVYTDRTPVIQTAAAAPKFVVSTTATLTPRFGLLPNLLD